MFYGGQFSSLPTVAQGVSFTQESHGYSFLGCTWHNPRRLLPKRMNNLSIVRKINRVKNGPLWSRRKSSYTKTMQECAIAMVKFIYLGHE